MAKVEFNHIVKKFGEAIAVNDFDITVKDGEFVSFLGPSGCGKTTTLRMIAGFIEPSEGSIEIGEKLVSDAENNIMLPPEKRNIGMVFQSYAVWPHMNVFKNVAYPLKLQKMKKAEIQKRVEKALAMVHLDGMEERFPHQLSGGQQQRVALARALVMEPKVLLLDEPLSNLDAKLREQMRFELKDLQDRINGTVIYVTHDQAEAMAMSDRIVVMNKGVVHQVGTPHEIYKSPEDSFVAGFVGLINFIDCRVISESEVEIDDGTKTYVIQTIAVKDLVGKNALLSVRPEDIDIVKENGDLSGRVERVVYLGNSIDYRIDVGNFSFRVISPPHKVYDEGETVELTLGESMVFEV